MYNPKMSTILDDSYDQPQQTPIHDDVLDCIFALNNRVDIDSRDVQGFKIHQLIGSGAVSNAFRITDPYNIDWVAKVAKPNTHHAYTHNYSESQDILHMCEAQLKGLGVYVLPNLYVDCDIQVQLYCGDGHFATLPPIRFNLDEDVIDQVKNMDPILSDVVFRIALTHEILEKALMDRSYGFSDLWKIEKRDNESYLVLRSGNIRIDFNGGIWLLDPLFISHYAGDNFEEKREVVNDVLRVLQL